MNFPRWISLMEASVMLNSQVCVHQVTILHGPLILTISVSIVSPPPNRVAYVEKLPYHRVYVGETTKDISSIGLPKEVPVVLVNGEKVNLPVAEWTVSGKEWNQEETGVYTFTGILAETGEYDNAYKRTATLYVYNRLPVPDNTRQAEWLDRGVIALSADNGIFISWRLRADDIKDIKFVFIETALN